MHGVNDTDGPPCLLHAVPLSWSGDGHAGAQPVGRVEHLRPGHVAGDGGMHCDGGAVHSEGAALQRVSGREGVVGCVEHLRPGHVTGDGGMQCDGGAVHSQGAALQRVSRVGATEVGAGCKERATGVVGRHCSAGAVQSEGASLKRVSREQARCMERCRAGR